MLLLLAQAESDAADVRAGRKRLLSNGQLVALNNGAPSRQALVGETGYRTGPELNLESVAEHSRTTHAIREAQAEINASKAVIYAEEMLANDAQEPPERTVDEDWLLHWRELAASHYTQLQLSLPSL